MAAGDRGFKRAAVFVERKIAGIYRLVAGVAEMGDSAVCRVGNGKVCAGVVCAKDNFAVVNRFLVLGNI